MRMADAANIKKNFTGDVMDELKKVTWPTRRDTVRLTTIVIGVSLIIGLYIGIIDILLAKGLEFVTKFR
ncbi:MAG: preprotein translocase subunit SecE [Patescibacteria group bacterium]